MNKKSKIVVVDYGLGNLMSVRRAIERVGGEPHVTAEPKDIRETDRLILPGVGAFGDGMKNLNERGLVGPIREYAKSGRPLFGICLGMQLLMTQSEEFGVHQGLNLIRGNVVRFPDPPPENPYRIPHIGWNTLHKPPKTAADFWKKSILEDAGEGVPVYFVHSYFVVPEHRETILAQTAYGGQIFCSAVRHGNIIGCQFHPEKSGEAGLGMYKSFIS